MWPSFPELPWSIQGTELAVLFDTGGLLEPLPLSLNLKNRWQGLSGWNDKAFESAVD